MIHMLSITVQLSLYQSVKSLIFKGRAIFRQFMPKKRKHFGTKIYKLYDYKGYTCNVTVYVGKD
jgi:hypothetical protein